MTNRHRLRFIAGFAAVLALSWVGPAGAGVYKGAGLYVVVYSSYNHYYGPIEGPFADRDTCEKRVKQLEAVQATRDLLIGSALFMCFKLDAPMDDDSGVWWPPDRP